jgi:hypothetical protein
MPEKVDDFQFSPEIKDLISSIKNERQWKILELLIQNNNELSFTKFKKYLEISDKEKFKLTYALKELVKGGWLRNQFKNTVSIEREKSFYSISDFGLKMVEGAIKATQIESYSKNVWSQFVETTQKEKPLGIIDTKVFLNDPSTSSLQIGWRMSNAASTIFSESIPLSELGRIKGEKRNQYAT